METRGPSRKAHQSPLDVNALAASVTEELNELPCLSDGCCIYRVPKRLRELNERVYTPRVVSIGPLHHGKDEFKAMENHKKRYLQEFLELSKVGVDRFISYVSVNETRIRNCYEEVIDFSSEKFVRIMLIDAVFLIMLMLKRCFPDIPRQNDRIFNKPWMISDIRLDIILLENQIPFFLLVELVNLSNIAHRSMEEISMIKITSDFLKNPWRSWVTDASESFRPSEVEHLLDFLRICQKPLEQQHQVRLKDAPSLPSALELHEAGVKFVVGSSTKLVDMKFDNGILEIPRLEIVDPTEMLFRNVQAFEQCHCSVEYIGNYIIMVNMLVQNREDVEILVKKGIIQNCLQDNDAVVRFLHNLSKENMISVNTWSFAGLVEDVNKYCRKRRHRWEAILRHNYFHNPWAIIAVLSAAYLLLLSTIQTVCSIIQIA